VEEAAESFTVGIMFGRFNPPHKGHIAAWDQMNEDSDLDAWYVGTNESTIGKKDPLPSDVKEIIIKTLYPAIKDHFVFEQTWLTLAAYVYKKYKKYKKKMTLICYTDEGYVLDLLKDYNGKELRDGKNYLFSSIILRPTERISSASALRAAVKNDDKRSFSEAAGISADTEITVGSKKIAYFDLVKTYLQKYIEEAAQPKKYFARLSDSTAKKRKSFWKGLGKYPFTKSEYEKADEVPGDSKETRPSKYNKKYKMMFGEEKKRSVTALKKKAKASGVPYSVLKQVYNRGMAAWVTGHRPGATQSAWAFARVNSFLTKGKTWYGADANLAKKARKYLKEAHMFGYTDWGWITPEGISVRPIESDKTHTSILRRLGEQSKYNLSKNETEFSVTKKGWIRWLLDKNELRFNTSKWNGSINVQKTINSIVNKYLNAKEYSFEWLGNSGEYQRIEVEDPGAFMLKLSVERRKGLMTEDQDNEIEMISGQLKKIIDLSTDTLNVIQNGSEIPAWIQDKISVSTHNAEAIFDYYHYSESKDIQESVEIISETIRCSKKTGKKVCFVLSKKGKKLGGPYSETKAKKRLRQIEFFKHLNK
jgi:hypothetical protein